MIIVGIGLLILAALFIGATAGMQLAIWCLRRDLHRPPTFNTHHKV